MMNQPRVYVYIFEEEDGKTPQERLETAVREYSKASGNARLGEIAVKKEMSEVLRVERTQAGKPYFPDCPDIQFSISHSGSYWACAVASETVGLDLQEHATQKKEALEEAARRFQKMAKRFFHPLEAAFVELDSYHNFFAVWAAREAYVKYTGQGIDKYFSEHCVVPVEEVWMQISGKKEDVRWHALGKSFWKTIYADHYTLCACTEAPLECVIVDCFNEEA